MEDDVGAGNMTGWVSEGENMTGWPSEDEDWQHPPQYVLRARWWVEGVLLPAVGGLGVIGGWHWGEESKTSIL